MSIVAYAHCMKRQHSRRSSWTVVLAANALVDEETPADRADVHAGVVVSLSADQLTGRTHQALRLTPASMVSTRQSNANPSVVCLPPYYVFGQKRMKRALHEAGYRCDRSIG
jgi:hypothetical protein